MPIYGKIIVIKRTGADGYNYPLTSSSCLFGRKTECDVRIQLPHVSKEHCKLEVNENNEVILINLSEVNETLLNGKAVRHSERLKHRDTFTVIDRSFRFEYPLDSVHNTSPRKKRNSSTSKTETLQVLHVQQELDDNSQPSVKDHSSTSGHKSDKVEVDKDFRVPTKSPKVTPNGREDPALQNQYRRSFTKIPNDGKTAGPENVSPFSKLYEMVKQQATKPTKSKPNKVDMFASVEESSTDLIKQTSIPAKESNDKISQDDKNPPTSASERMSRRMSKIRLEEGMMTKEDENEEMRELNPRIEDIANADFSISTGDINTPKKMKMEVNKFTEQPSSEAKITSIIPLSKGGKGKEQNNDKTTKSTPKAKHKSQFIKRKSLTLDATPKKFEEILEPSLEKRKNVVVHNTTFESAYIPGNIEKKKDEIPKLFVGESLQCKNENVADIELEKPESTNFSEPSMTKSGIENNLVGTPVGKDDEEKFDTPKSRGRPSLGKNVDGAGIESEQVESTNILKSSAANSGIANDSVNKGFTPVRINEEKFGTPKRRSRSSLRNNNVDDTNIDSEMGEPIKFSEPSAAKSGMENNLLGMECTPVRKIGEQFNTLNRRSRPSLPKNIEGASIESEQVQSTNFSKSSIAKLGMDSITVNMGLMPVKIGEEKVDTPKRRSRSSLCKKNEDGAESTNALKLSVANSGMANNTVNKGLALVKIDETKVHTPKRRSRSSMHNKNVDSADSDLEQDESTSVMESSAEKLMKKNNSISTGHLAANMDEEKFRSAKTRGRPSLSNKKVEAADIHSEQTEFTNVSEPSAAKLWGEIKSVSVGCTQVKIDEEKPGTPKSRSRSLCLKNVETIDIQEGQAASAEVLESPITAKSELEDKLLEMQHAETLKKLGRLSPCEVPSMSESPVQRGGGSPSSPFQLVKKRESNVVEENLKGKNLTSRSPQDLTKKQTEESVPRLSKKRTSENENLVLKRKKVSFGVNLSPEVFDKHMPPCSPLRKGGTPTRVSTPFQLARCAVSKRKSSRGIDTCTIQECSEQSKSFIMSNIPSANASGKFSQKKFPSSNTKKSPLSKTLSTFSCSTKSSQITAGSFGSPHLIERFSISHVATPPNLTQPVKSCITPKNLSLAQMDESQQKSSSGKKASRKSTRKSSLLAQIQSRRQSGASIVNLLVKKSWAQVVKEGVARPQLRNVAKKSVKRKRAKNVVSLKVTPARLVKDHFSTGHATSPATIVIGKSQATNAKPTRQTPWRTRTVSLRKKDNAMDESFTGMAEMFSTPMHINERENPVTQSLSIDDAETAVAIPISQKMLENSASKTPEETGVKAVAPLNILNRSSGGHKTVLRLLKCRADLYCSSNSHCESTAEVTEISSEAEGTGDLQRIKKTPRMKGEPVEDLVGVKRIMKTPRMKGQPVEDLVGVKRIMKTPRVKGQPVEDLVGVKRIMKTPRMKGQPVEDLVGVKRIMKTPRVKGQPVEDLVGVKRIMKTPRVKGQPVEDMVGVKRIMKTPRMKGQPVEDMVGVKRIMRSPRVKWQPVENFAGLSKLLAEPKQKTESPEINYIGIKNLFSSKKEMENCDYSGLGEMFSTPVKIERISDSKLQLGSKSADKSSALLGDAQTTETSENNLIQTGQKHNGASIKETSSSGTDCDSTLTLRAQGIRTRSVQAKCISSPPSQERVQQSHQAETSPTSPKDDLADIPQIGITEYKDGWSLTSTQVSPARKSLKEKKIEDAEESIKNTPGMNGCTDEGIEEVSKMSSTKELLKEEKILDDVKIFMPNKSTPDKKQSDCMQTGQVIVFNSQKLRSLKEKDEIPNILNVEVEGPDSTTKSTIMSRNESSNKKIKEVNNLVSPMTKSLRGRKNVKDDYGAKVKEMTQAESQDGQICEAKIIASPETKALKGKEIQDVKVSPPTSAKICMQREGQISTSANEELMPLPLRKRQQSKTKSNKSKITEMEETTSIAKSSQSKKGTQCAQIEELVNSPLEKLSQNKNEIESVESKVMKNEPALPKISTKRNEVKYLATDDVKAPIATGRPRRRKNITAEEIEMHEHVPKKTNSRKKAACPTPVEVAKESSSLQSISRDQEEGSNPILNSGQEGSEREEEKSESVKAPEKIDTANSKYRSRRKRVIGELISEDFKLESYPVKRLRKGEKLDETLTRETDNAVQTSQRGSNRREVSKWSCREKVAIKNASEQASIELVETSRKHPNSKITIGVSDEQPEGTTKQKTGSSCEQLLIKKDKNDNEMKRETKEPTESALNLSPLPPIKRLQRKKVGQKVIQNGEKNVKELPCTRKLRNIMEQKLEVTTDDGPCVPVKMDSHKVKTAILIETMPSSRIMEKGKKAKTSVTENKEQTHQQPSLAIVDTQFNIRNENKLPNQKINGKGRQRGKTSSKGISACLSNVENVSDSEWKHHLNVSANCNEVVNNSDKIETIRQTRSSSKGKVSKIVINDTKEMDVMLSPVYEENARPKKYVRKGKSEKVTMEGSKEVPLIESPKTELDNRKLPEVAIDKRGRRKIVKEDVLAIVQEIVKEGLQINNEVGESVEIPRMTKRSTLAVINQELSLGITESKQLESSDNKVEKKRARKGQNSIKETAILPEAQGGKGRVINKRGRRTNPQEQLDNDENLPHQQDKTEKNGRKQETVIISMESSQVSKRVTRAKKSCEVTEMEQELLQPLASELLTQVSVHPSKRTLRGKHTVAETAPDVPAKKAKKEKVIGKETSQSSKTGKAAASSKKGLSITPPTAKPKGPTTRSRK